jgi:hypothetical protein
MLSNMQLKMEKHAAKDSNGQNNFEFHRPSQNVCPAQIFYVFN